MAVSTLGILCVLGLGPGLATPDTPSPSLDSHESAESALAILRRVDEATKAVHTVRYKARAYGTEWLAEQYARVEGTAVFTGGHERNFLVARFDVSVIYARTSLVHRLTYGADGESFYLIEHENKTCFENVDPRVVGQGGRTAQLIGMREFVHPTPFDDELNGDSVTLLGRERVGTELCHVVDVVYAEKSSRAVWYFSVNDHLPRRVDRVVENTKLGRAAVVTEISELEANPQVKAKFFKLIVPTDYVRSSAYAFDMANRPR